MAQVVHLMIYCQSRDLNSGLLIQNAREISEQIYKNHILY